MASTSASASASTSNSSTLPGGKASSSETIYKLPKPNDQNEQSRLDMQHQVWLLTFDGQLTAPGLPAEFTPHTVLDVGCGSGAWALSYAQAYPNREVVATDITPPAIENKPSNLTITSSADAQKEAEWPKDRMFDYIHIRLLTLAIRDWPSVISLCWKHLNPGGWLEIDDARFPYAAENEQANIENSLFLRSSYLQVQAQKMNQLDVMASYHHMDRLKLQGFSNISQSTEKWPVNGQWPQDEKYKQIGTMTGRNWELMFGKYGPIILTSKLQMSNEKATSFVQDMLEEVRTDRDMHYYFPMDITVAQKPISGL